LSREFSRIRENKLRSKTAGVASPAALCERSTELNDLPVIRIEPSMNPRMIAVVFENVEVEVTDRRIVQGVIPVGRIDKAPHGDSGRLAEDRAAIKADENMIGFDAFDYRVFRPIA
jgi:hypothetical protein